MNRLPIYKAKRLNGNEWVRGCLIYQIDPTKEVDTMIHAWITEGLGLLSSTFPVQLQTISEYSFEVDDKNDEIYEGHIVETTRKQPYHHPSRYLVVHNKEYGGLRLRHESRIKDNDHGFYDESISSKEFVTKNVIGNIYDNPELLRQ